MRSAWRRRPRRLSQLGRGPRFNNVFLLDTGIRRYDAVLERNLALRDLSGRGLRRLHLGVEAAHGLARELLGRLEAPIAGALAQRERRRLVHVLEQIVQRRLIGMG